MNTIKTQQLWWVCRSEESLKGLLELTESCGKIVIFSGSGLSANSGGLAAVGVIAFCGLQPAFHQPSHHLAAAHQPARRADTPQHCCTPNSSQQCAAHTHLWRAVCAGMSMFTTKNGLYERARSKFKIQDGMKLFSYPFYKQRRKDLQVGVMRLSPFKSHSSSVSQPVPTSVMDALLGWAQLGRLVHPVVVLPADDHLTVVPTPLPLWPAGVLCSNLQRGAEQQGSTRACGDRRAAQDGPAAAALHFEHRRPGCGELSGTRACNKAWRLKCCGLCMAYYDQHSPMQPSDTGTCGAW